MWTKVILGIDVYHLIAAFVLYSVLGWFVESVYMSFCNRKITNRGFGKGPFCPIYGFGALGAYIMFSPFRGNYILVYILGCITATIFEYLVGKAMIKFLGELWWDYNEKPFNFQGIICLESTLAWGIYAIGIVHFLHDKLIALIDKLNMNVGIRVIYIILLMVFVDYVVQFLHIFQVDVKEKAKKIHKQCVSFITRWI